MMCAVILACAGAVQRVLHPYGTLTLYSLWFYPLELICYNHRHDFHAY